MRILFIEPYPKEGASSRYRVEQYIPYFEANGFKCRVRPFISSAFYKILYKKGMYLRKTFYFLISSIKRFFDIFPAMQSDIIFIHLESFPFGPPIFEYICRSMGKKIIYDLDDAIYLRSSSPANSFMKYLRSPSKIKKIIKISDAIIACNEYLADFARKFNDNVTFIHTSVDTDRFTPGKNSGRNGKDITIGWIGSHSTAPYLDQLKGVFKKLAERYKFNLKIIGAGSYDFMIPGVRVQNIPWQLDTEIDEFRSLDIGVYPLPDNEWVKGKTGFKTIQYMSVGVPCVVTGVGANRHIVKNGINGYLVKTEDEWVERLSSLIENPELRKEMGKAGKKTVEEKYSIKANVGAYIDIFGKI